MVYSIIISIVLASYVFFGSYWWYRQSRKTIMKMAEECDRLHAAFRTTLVILQENKALSKTDIDAIDWKYRNPYSDEQPHQSPEMPH